MFGEVLDREIAFLDYKNIVLNKSQYCIFPKLLVHVFLLKIVILLIVFLSQNRPNESVW